MTRWRSSWRKLLVDLLVEENNSVSQMLKGVQLVLFASVCTRNSLRDHDFQSASEPPEFKTTFLGGEEGVLVTLNILFPVQLYAF